MRFRPLALLMFLAAASSILAQPIYQTATSTFTPGFEARAIGDFDGNGLDDVVQTGFSQVGMFLNIGTSSLPTALPTALHGSPIFPFGSRVANDFNGDGFLDLAFMEWPMPDLTLKVMLGDGLGGLGTPITVASLPDLGGWLRDLAIGDFNGDGRYDACILQTSSSTSVIDVLLSTWSPTTSTGSWTHAQIYSGPGSARIGVADVNGDGYDDIISWFFTPTPTSVDVYLGDPFGTTLAPLTVQFGAPSSVHSFGDLNGDGAADMVVNGANGYAVRFGGSPNIFASSIGVPSPPTFAAIIRVMDFDGDGNGDILFNRTAGGYPHEHYMLRGDGAGGFGSVALLTTTPPYWKYVRGDLDGDGDIDIFAYGGTQTSTQARIYRNDAIYGTGCAGAGGVPTFDIGAPIPGNAAFEMAISSAPPGAAAALGISIARANLPACVGLQINLQLLLVEVNTLSTTTNAQGTASFSLPLPNEPGLVGTTVHAQWGVLDPTGGLTIGAFNFSTSRARAIRFF